MDYCKYKNTFCFNSAARKSQNAQQMQCIFVFRQKIIWPRKENQKNRICWKIILNNSRFVRHEFMCDMSVICWNPQIFQMLVSVCFSFLFQNSSFRPLFKKKNYTFCFGDWWEILSFFKDCGQDGASLSFLNNVCSNDLNEKKKGSSSGSPLNMSERYVYLHCCLFTIFSDFV